MEGFKSPCVRWYRLSAMNGWVAQLLATEPGSHLEELGLPINEVLKALALGSNDGPPTVT